MIRLLPCSGNRRFWHTKSVVAILIAGLFPGYAESFGFPDDPAASTVEESGVDLLLMDDSHPRRLQLRWTSDAAGFHRQQNRAYEALMRYYDRDGDKRLDSTEASRLPSAFCLRQLSTGLWTPYTGTPPRFRLLDQDGNGRVTVTELAHGYRQYGLELLQVAAGFPPGTSRLDEAIVRLLDRDHDRIIAPDEWKDADLHLMSRDANGNELVDPDELVPGLIYPGTAGVIAIPPAGACRTLFCNPDLAAGPACLKKRLSSLRWGRLPPIPIPSESADAIVRNLNRNGDDGLDEDEARLPGKLFQKWDTDKNHRISSGELVHGLTSLPAICCQVTFPNAHQSPVIEVMASPEDLQPFPVNAGMRLELAALAVSLQARPGNLDQELQQSRIRLEHQFQEADLDQNRSVESHEVGDRRFDEIRQLLQVADRNGDGRLSREELAAWSDLSVQVSRNMFLLTILDFGAGWFERLDTNQDGTLSHRELRNGRVGRRRSHQLRLIVSRGHPLPETLPHATIVRNWFQAMDRNDDGDLTPREFLGTPVTFELLDADGDGLISRDEALGYPTEKSPG